MTAPKRNNKNSQHQIEEFRGQLLDWYDRQGRDLPWRVKGGGAIDPYHVWLSEVMLQQTTVQAVKPYFEKFLRLWPRIEDLANAEASLVMQEWAGLGYYARARNLHACAQEVVRTHGGKFPDAQEALRTLPGIGEYTSAAISAIAFNRPAVVVDGNIERIMARLYRVQAPMPGAKSKLKELAAPYFEGFTQRPGDLAQAFMDLGATICLPKAPRCSLCPVQQHCLALAANDAESYPRRAAKKAKPQRHGHIYWIEDEQGQVLLEQRPDKGLLGGMIGLPTSEWVSAKKDAKHPDFICPESLQHQKAEFPVIMHSFTHFDLHLQPVKARITGDIGHPGYFWKKHSELRPQTFPTVFKKPLKIFLAETAILKG